MKVETALVDRSKRGFKTTDLAADIRFRESQAHVPAERLTNDTATGDKLTKLGDGYPRTFVTTTAGHTLVEPLRSKRSNLFPISA